MLPPVAPAGLLVGCCPGLEPSGKLGSLLVVASAQSPSLLRAPWGVSARLAPVILASQGQGRAWHAHAVPCRHSRASIAGPKHANVMRMTAWGAAWPGAFATQARLGCAGCKTETMARHIAAALAPRPLLTQTTRVRAHAHTHTHARAHTHTILRPYLPPWPGTPPPPLAARKTLYPWFVIQMKASPNRVYSYEEVRSCWFWFIATWRQAA